MRIDGGPAIVALAQTFNEMLDRREAVELTRYAIRRGLVQP